MFVCVKVLTLVDWNEVLYNGIENTNSWASLYFIALITFGNYVLFNVLVAILVEGFSNQVCNLSVFSKKSRVITSDRKKCANCALVRQSILSG